MILIRVSRDYVHNARAAGRSIRVRPFLWPQIEVEAVMIFRKSSFRTSGSFRRRSCHRIFLLCLSFRHLCFRTSAFGTSVLGIFFCASAFGTSAFGTSVLGFFFCASAFGTSVYLPISAEGLSLMLLSTDVMFKFVITFCRSFSKSISSSFCLVTWSMMAMVTNFAFLCVCRNSQFLFCCEMMFGGEGRGGREGGGIGRDGDGPGSGWGEYGGACTIRENLPNYTRPSTLYNTRRAGSRTS